jgi:hypothetical protein
MLGVFNFISQTLVAMFLPKKKICHICHISCESLRETRLHARDLPAAQAWELAK